MGIVLDVILIVIILLNVIICYKKGLLLQQRVMKMIHQIKE